eukprot:4138341-Amphidinium_carterae.3
MHGDDGSVKLPSALDSYDLLCRSLQFIRTAHATNPSAPDYSMSDIVMWPGQSKLGVSPSLSKYREHGRRVTSAGCSGKGGEEDEGGARSGKRRKWRGGKKGDKKEEA